MTCRGFMPVHGDPKPRHRQVERLLEVEGQGRRSRSRKRSARNDGRRSRSSAAAYSVRTKRSSGSFRTFSLVSSRSRSRSSRKNALSLMSGKQNGPRLIKEPPESVDVGNQTNEGGDTSNKETKASVVVQERIIVVTPDVTVTKSSPTPSPKLFKQRSSPSPDKDRKEVAANLASIANSIKPMQPYLTANKNRKKKRSNHTSAYSQVKVTDEEAGNYLEYDFRRPPSPREDLPDYLDKTQDVRGNNDLQKVRLRRRSRRGSEDSQSGSSSKSGLNSDPGIVVESFATPAMRGGIVVGQPESNIYGADVGNSQSQVAEEPRIRNESSPERPSWGFGPSRAASRLDDGYLDGFESDDSADSATSKRSDRNQSPENNGSKDRRGGRGRNGGKSRKGRKGRDGSYGKGIASNTRIRQSALTSKFKEEMDNYRATKITLYKNGDPWFGSMEYRFILGKDLANLDGLFHNVNNKMDFITGISHMFDTDGTRITSIDQVVDGGEYVCASDKHFVPANYGRIGKGFLIDGGAQRNRLTRRISHSKKTGSAPSGKPNSADGRIIKIVNAADYSITERVLLNLKTTQAFEDVVRDLGQVLKLRGANKLYSKTGKEVRSFSHLRMDFKGQNTFIVSSGPCRVTYASESEDDESRSPSPSPRGSSTSLAQGRYGSEPSLNQFSLGAVRGSKKGHRSRSRSPGRGNGSDSNVAKITINGVRKSFYGPTNASRETIRAPSETMVMDWIYGYSSNKDLGKNLWIDSKGDLLYFVGAVAVLCNKISENQRLYTEHTADITCMDLHPSREFVASGQKGGRTTDAKPHIRIWSALTLETKNVIGFGECEVSVACVAFSSLNKGDFVMCVDSGKEATMSVWRWKDKSLIGRASTDQKLPKGCAFHPLDNNLVITYGKDHLVFWNRRKDGFFERTDIVKPGIRTKIIMCMEFLESGDLAVGDDDGNICTFSVSNEGEYFMSNEFQAHSASGGVACLYLVNEHTLVSGGIKDQAIVAWDATRDFEKLMEAKIPEGMGCAGTIISYGSNDGNLLIGTDKGVILDGSIQKNKFSVVVWSHAGEIRGLATHPEDLVFITAGYEDKTVAKWRKQKVSWKLTLGANCCSAAFHPSSQVIVVGTDEGHLVALNASSGAEVTTTKIAANALNAIAFNRHGDSVAIATQQGAVFLYNVSKEGQSYKKYSKISGADQSPLTLDWSLSGDYLQTMGKDMDLTFYNVKTNRMDRVGLPYRDVEWMEQTCPVGYSVSGAWNNVNSKNDDALVTTVHVGTNKTLMVAGDSDGFVRLFRYPCTSSSSEYVETKPSGSSPKAVRFMFDDIYVLATIGSLVFRWKIK